MTTSNPVPGSGMHADDFTPFVKNVRIPDKVSHGE